MENKKISQLDPYSGNPDSFDIPGVADGQTLKTNLGAAIQKKITSERLLSPSDLKTVNGVPLTGQGDIALELVNPFKGWYDSLEGLQTAVGSPAVGDYAYIKGAAASDPAAIYECTTAGTWSDSGRTIDTSNVQTFKSGQAVSGVAVKDLYGNNDPNADGVLSAEAGVALNSRVTSVEDKFEHQGYVFDEVTDFSVVDVYPDSDNQWTGRYGAYGKYIAVSPGDVIRLTRQNYGGFFAILTSSETFTVGETLSSAEGWNGRQSTSAITGTEAGGYGDITMPEDAAYFYVSVKSTGASTPLQDVIVSKRRVVTVPGIDTEVEQLEAQIAELPNKIVSETQDVPYTLETSTGCVNGETGADLTASLWTRTEFVDVSELKGESISFLGKILITEGIKAGYAFYSERNTNSVVSCMKYDFDTTLSEGVNKWYDVIVPQGANYFRASVYNEIKDDFKIKTKSTLVELIEEVSGADATISNGITHLRPDNQGQLNAVKRMRKMTDIEWVPAFDLARGSSAGGRSFYNNKFLAGRRYKGIPYARADKSKYGYTDANTKGSGNNGSNFKVGLRIGLETFMTAICNRGTVMEMESVYSYGLHQAAFYANICAGGVSAALHIDYLTSANFGASNPPSGFTHIGTVNDPNFSLKSLKLGDVLVNPTEHTAMVTDVIIQNDEVVFVEVGENTTQGNGNYTIEGYEFGGLARRLWWNVSDFMRVWGNYKVRRYNNIANVPYIPSPYVPMPDENYGYARYTMAVLPYMGNNFKYMLVDGVVPEECRKLIVEEPSTGVVDANGGTTGVPVVFWNKKIDGEWVSQTPIEIDYTSYDANSHPYVYVPLPSDMGVGEYEAYISIKYDDATTRDSTKCYWQVVDSLPLLEDF